MILPRLKKVSMADEQLKIKLYDDKRCIYKDKGTRRTLLPRLMGFIKDKY